MCDQPVSAAQNNKASPGYYRYMADDIMTNTMEPILPDHPPAESSKSPQICKTFSHQTIFNMRQADVEPCIIGHFSGQNSKLSERSKAHYSNETNIVQHDVKPCIAELLCEENSKLSAEYKTLTTETSARQHDVKPCITDKLIRPNYELPLRFEASVDETNSSQSDIKPLVTNLSLSPNSEPSQTQHYEDYSHERIAGPSNVKTCFSELAFMPKCESAPELQTCQSPVPIWLVKNKVFKCKRVTSLTSSDQNIPDCKENEDCGNKKGMDKKLTENISSRPDTANLCQSNIGCFTPRNEDLENDVADKPLSSVMLMTDHGQESQLKGSDYGTSLEANSLLRPHVKTHLGKKIHECNICLRRFAFKSKLITHERIHTGDKPFKCQVCEHSFSSNGYLRVHMRTHTGEKPFKCHECGKGFSQSTHLHMHIKTHTGEKPFKCNMCGKGFGQSNNLHVHMRSHTGEKVHECNECGKSFVQSSNLRVHMRTHTGERPFKCNECGKSFAKSSYVRVHMRTHADGKQNP